MDAEFHKLLEQVFTDNVLKQFQEKYPNDILDLLLDFELKKRTFKPSQTNGVHFKLPATLMEEFGNEKGSTVENTVAMSDLRENIVIKRDKMTISVKLFESFFHQSVSDIMCHLLHLFETGPSGVETILLVGGYSESEIIRRTIQNEFPNKRIICPDDASLAVLKGAVLFGHEPESVKSRVCKHTYGIAMRLPFRPDRHPLEKKIIADGKEYVDDVFDIHLEIGQVVSTDSEGKGRKYFVPKGHKYVVLDVYASQDPKPRFVTEPSCLSLGNVVIELDDDSTDCDTVIVTIHYRGTEIGVVARETRTRKITKAQFNFLV